MSHLARTRGWSPSHPSALAVTPPINRCPSAAPGPTSAETVHAQHRRDHQRLPSRPTSNVVRMLTRYRARSQARTGGLLRLPAGGCLALTALALCLAVASPAPASEAEGTIAWAYRVSETHGSDQVVFTFRGGIPGWRAGYVPAERADASGQLVSLEGRAYLNITFFPAARASVPGSFRPTQAERVDTPRLAILRQIKPAGNFEGYVSFGLGLSRRVRFRISKLLASDQVVLTLQR